jgi:Domain of unknown function (DUF4263)
METEQAADADNYFSRTLRWIAELDELDLLLGVLQDPVIGDEADFCRAACQRALALDGGVVALYRSAWDQPRLKGTIAVLATLWAAHRGEHVRIWLRGSDLPGLKVPISREVADSARWCLSDLMAEATQDGSRFHAVLQFAMQELFTDFGERGLAELAGLLADTSVSLTWPTIEGLRRRVQDDDLPEAEYQSYLAAHPVLLDPLAAETIDRHRLGSDLITDFVVRRHDNRYVAVEIEKPRDRIFTKQGEFTADFTHAFGQVVDFIGWLDENVAYARTKLADLEAPDGLLVMGRRSDLSEIDSARLRRFCQNSRRVDVCTFDDLVHRSASLYASMRRGD